MNTQEQEAVKVMKQVIDISIAKGIFQNAESVVNVYNAYSIIQKALEPKQAIEPSE